MSDMANVQVHRYEQPATWAGWIEPDDRSWILFIREDGGDPAFFPHRDPETGAVLDAVPA